MRVDRANTRDARTSIDREAEPDGDAFAVLGSAGPAQTSIYDDLLVDGFSLDAHEADLIHRALVKAGGKKTEAARLLGITRRRLYSRLECIGRRDEDS